MLYVHITANSKTFYLQSKINYNNLPGLENDDGSKGLSEPITSNCLEHKTIATYIHFIEIYIATKSHTAYIRIKLVSTVQQE